MTSLFRFLASLTLLVTIGTALADAAPQRIVLLRHGESTPRSPCAASARSGRRRWRRNISAPPAR
ncbi:hypothetical protein [Ancylobacter dichloromethanicus]|uniref:hypothetical protein n=1 Tax=Ancylobacter dichloromethanicus TaxID=518825 RepID=UPI0036182393